MKILIDENMPYAEARFCQLGEVTMMSGRTLTADDLVDVDALMIRSVTKVNEALIIKRLPKMHETPTSPGAERGLCQIQGATLAV